MEKPNIQVQSLSLESFMEWGTCKEFSVFVAFQKIFQKTVWLDGNCPCCGIQYNTKGGVCVGTGTVEAVKTRPEEGGAETMSKWVKRILMIIVAIVVLFLVAMIVWMVFNFAGFKAFLAG